jgi:hypothetical protein
MLWLSALVLIVALLIVAFVMAYLLVSIRTPTGMPVPSDTFPAWLAGALGLACFELRP